MGDFYMSNEAFKNFVRSKPELIKYVQNGEMTWQNFMSYMIYMVKMKMFGINIF